MSGGDGNGTAENTLVSLVKKLFRWVGPSESSVASSSSLSTESSWPTTELISSDLNGNLSGRRNQSNDGDGNGTTIPPKDPFRTSRLRQAFGEVGVCRMCGVVGSSEFQTTIGTTRQPIVVCVRCKKLAIDRRNRDRPAKDASRGDDEDGGRYAPSDGHPVCCCDSCSAVAIRLRRQPPGYQYQSYDEMYSSSELLVPSTSLPTSLESYTSTIQRFPRASSSDNDDESTQRHPIRWHRTNPSVLDQYCPIQPPMVRPRPRSGLDVDLPPSIPLSADGEEGFVAYRRNLIARNLAAQNDVGCGQAPPNVTIRHLTSDDGVV